MRFKAHEVLDDCREALEMLESETDMQRWRILWAAAVALIKTVGSVLDKVDAKRFPEINEKQKGLYKSWKSDNPAHSIFRDFIENERNNILKEYKLSIHPSEKVSILLTQTLIHSQTGEAYQLEDVYDLDEQIYRPMLEGPWEGDDARDVLAEAISWWDKQLDIIIDHYRQSQPTK